MALYGQLSTMSLMDLLQWAGMNRKTGVFELERNRISKKLMFRSGRVVACYCDDPQSRLGQFLMARGKITPDQLREALGRQEQSGDSVGNILQEMGLVDERELTELMSQKAEEMILSLFDWTEAVFRFEEHGSLGPYVIDVDLAVDDILLKGLQRVDELSIIRQVFHSSGIVLERTKKPLPREIDTSSMARRIVQSIDGERTLAEIMLHTNSSEFLVLKFLYNLYNRGTLAIREIRATDADTVTIVDPWRSRGEAATSPPADPERLARDAELTQIDALLGDASEPARYEDEERVDPDAPLEFRFESESESESESEAESEAEARSDSDTGSGSASDPGTEPDPERGTKAEADAETEETFDFSGLDGSDDDLDFSDVQSVTDGGGADPDAVETVDEASEAVRRLALEMEETLTIVPWRDRSGVQERGAPQAQAQAQAQAAAEAGPQGADALDRARAAVEAGDWPEALDRLDACYRERPDDPHVKEWMARAERGDVEGAADVGLSPTSIPVRAAGRDGEKLPAQSSYILSLVDGVTEIRALFWLAPMREVEVLRILARLRDGGWIEIREAPAPAERPAADSAG